MSSKKSLVTGALWANQQESSRISKCKEAAPGNQVKSRNQAIKTP
jgi:hypothetical protein